MRRTPRRQLVLGVALPLVIACGIISLPAWHGPIILSLSITHGIDTGDLLAVPFVLLGFAAARRVCALHDLPPGRWLAPAAALVLGLVLLSGNVFTNEGGPIAPAGGATLDGTIRETYAKRGLPIGRWTNVALTYDGAAERLYMNGSEVSAAVAGGRVETPGSPLWIGGNHPYGEHFDGLIDEVRVYDRALDGDELRHDMTSPVAPARGLVAGYRFDLGKGSRATDASGEGNTGWIDAATWSRGRFGDALRFDGDAATVRVPPSRSLDVTGALTLSAWIFPTAGQSGWNTIVQREADAYFLSTSTRESRDATGGPLDSIQILLFATAALGFCFAIATGRGPRSGPRRRSWWLPVVLFASGSCADAAVAPSAALFGCILVALWLAATASGRLERLLFGTAALAFVSVTIASLADLGGLRGALTYDDGSIARTNALGLLFVLAGAAALVATLGERLGWVRFLPQRGTTNVDLGT